VTQPNPATATDPAEHELDERFKLLEFSYREVLDATKHQDDKINRLLTTAAFLTAASLALAGLISGKAVTAHYLVDHNLQLPLALIALAGFLGGITVAVIMLISSLTTPLVFPGGSKPILPKIPYVTSAKFGQVYFYEIAKTAPPEWYAKWESSTADLKLERNASLVRETHNLAVRTDFKYQRSNEAVAVLSFAMLSFVLSALLILIASQRPNQALVDLNWTARSVLATIFFLYCWLQLTATQRNTPPTVFERAYPDRGSGNWPKFSRLGYPLFAAGVLLQLQLVPSESPFFRFVFSCAVPLVAWLAFVIALPWPSAKGAEKQLEVAIACSGAIDKDFPSPKEGAVAKRKKELRGSVYIAGLITAAYVAVGLWAARSPIHRETVALGACYASGLILLLSSLWQVARKPVKPAEEFQERYQELMASRSPLQQP
jgi:hypothetical protein